MALSCHSALLLMRAVAPSTLTSLSHLLLQPCLSRCSHSTSAQPLKSSKQPPTGSQTQLVDTLLKAGGPFSDRVLSALRAVDKRHFVQTYSGVPDTVAYQDTALPISCGQTMPAFSVHARFLALLEPHVQPGARVLDLGAGTGYMAACLAQLAGPQGQVLALEKQPKLAERARAAIQASLPALHSTVDVCVCNVMADPPELQEVNRFDAIHVGASLTELPRNFVQLLRPGGRLVAPLGSMHGAAPQVIITLDKGADGTLTQQQHGSLTTRIQPLTQTQDDKIWD